MSAPSSSSNNALVSVPTVPEPRPPRNLQDLLRFAVETGETSASNNNVGPLDPERRRFLEEALKAMTVDVAKEMADAINKLKTMENPETTLEASEYEAALDTIADYVDNIDAAIDFYKLGGFDIVRTCLQSTYPGVRWRIADVVAVCTQNNPFCQGHAVNMNFLPLLLNMVEFDADEQCEIKSFYAISCIVRDNSEALNQFVNLDGFGAILRAVRQTFNDRVRLKFSFFISCIIEKNLNLIDDLVRLGYVEFLMLLLHSRKSINHEYIASSLVCLVQHSEEAVEICKKNNAFVRTLQRLIENENDEVNEEEMVHLKQLMVLLYNNDRNEVER